jgi:hypothetical protein
MATASSNLYLSLKDSRDCRTARDGRDFMSELKDNAALSRFEMVEAGQTVFADYRRAGGRLFIDHVEAPVALRGGGAAGRFMEALVEMARGEGATLVPICGYAAAWLQRHPDRARGVV